MTLGLMWVASATLVTAAVCVGLGRVLPHQVRANDWLIQFWHGWTLLTALLLAVHLVAPIGAWLLPWVAAISAIGWIGRRPTPGSVPLEGGGSWTINDWAVALGIGGATSLLSAFAPPFYDFGLYYSQTILWFLEHPAVPGLANLHLRLGLNNSSFAPTALLAAVVPIDVRHVALTAPVTITIIELARRVKTRWHPYAPAWSRWVPLMLLPPTLLWTARGTASASPDVVVYCLQVVIGLRLLDLVLADKAASTRPIDVIVLSATLVTVKPSAAAFSIAAVVALLLTTEQRNWKGLAGPALVVGLVVGVPWVLHGIVLSGYPVFPLAVLGMPVDWRVPEVLVQHEARVIADWARSHQHWYWPEWIAMAAPLTGATFLALRPAGRKRLGAWLPVIAPAAIGVGFVVATAPDPRFAGATPWLLIACLLGVWLDGTSSPTSTQTEGTVLAWSAFGLLAIASVPLFATAVLALSADPFRPVPVIPHRDVALDDGGSVFVPATGDQSFWWPVPATTHPPGERDEVDSRWPLELRSPTDLRSGFRRLPEASELLR